MARPGYSTPKHGGSTLQLAMEVLQRTGNPYRAKPRSINLGPGPDRQQNGPFQKRNSHTLDLPAVRHGHFGSPGDLGLQSSMVRPILQTVEGCRQLQSRLRCLQAA